MNNYIYVSNPSKQMNMDNPYYHQWQYFGKIVWKRQINRVL